MVIITDIIRQINTSLSGIEFLKKKHKRLLND